MRVDPLLKEEVTEFLLTEADCIDERRWDEFLELYEEDATFHVPAWDDDNDHTDDPATELSLIYCGSRERLWERIWRIRSGLSSSLFRLPRTCHLVTNIKIVEAKGDAIQVTANFLTKSYKHEEKRADEFFGRYTYDLVRRPGGSDRGSNLGIKKKHALVYNDLIPRQMDFFNI